MIRFNAEATEIEDGVLLISGAGDRDTGGGLCALDGEVVERIDRVSSAGLTYFDGRLARFLRGPVCAGGGEVLLYDRHGISHYLRIDEVSDGHYMAWDGQCLIVASTGNNSLLWLALSGEIVRRWRAPGADDSCHLNDICLVGKDLYACAFGKYSHHRDYKPHLSRGDGFVFEVASGKAVATGLCAPHSPRYYEGAWTICDSLRKSVVRFDANGCREKAVELRSFTRGMAVTDDYLIIGESADRTADKNSSIGTIAILRRTDLSFVWRTEVPFSEVFDVALVSRSLLASVRTGFRTNPLRVGETDQLLMFRDAGIEPRRIWAVSERLSQDQFKAKIEASIPSQFDCGKSTLVECEIKNLSDAFLSSELPFPIHLSYKWKDPRRPGEPASGDGVRTLLPRTLPPGSSFQCRMEVLAPDIEGEFEIVISLVQENIAWFSDVDPSNGFFAKVTVSRTESTGPNPAVAGS